MATLDQLQNALVKADAAGDADAARAFAAEIRRMKTAAPAEAKVPEESGGFLQGLGNLAAGAVRGAGSIGATLMTPVDAAARAVGIENSFIGRNDRREAMDAGLQTMGAQPESLMYKGGKIGGEIAGTAGVGGALGNLARVGGAAPSVVNALQTAGMGGGGSLLTRIGAGAVTGATTAGMVNPEDAGTGAIIGGAIPGAAPVVRSVGRGLRRGIGATTGVGDAALSQAYQAGKAGGTQAQQFTDAMRGGSAMDDVLSAAKDNLAQMGQQKQQAYRSGIANVKADKSVLGFDGIDDAVKNAREMAMFKGQAKNPRAAELVQKVSDEVAAWKALDPAEYHTPEGLDALKQRIGGLLESIPFEEKTSRTAVGNIYNSIKGEISKQAPEYSKVMRDYSEATDTIREIEKALSLGNKASADTSMRKLQSLMRNNVNTSYGYRDQLAQKMVEQGGNELLPMLAGQALNEWTPRGLQRAAAGSGASILALTGNPLAAAGTASLSSPRLAGEAVYGLGRVAGAVPNNRLADLMLQSGARAAPVLGAQ